MSTTFNDDELRAALVRLAPVQLESVQTTASNLRTQRWCLLAGPAGLTLYLAGMLMAGILPPLAAHASAQSIAAHWTTHADLRRAGLALMIFAGAMIGPFISAIAVQIKRIEGAHSPLTYSTIGLGYLALLVFIVPPMIMEVAAFRAARDASQILLINDLAWLPFVGLFTPFFFLCAAVAAAAFADPQGAIFPRWLGYLSIWVAIAFIPAELLFFFKTGAFAWQGLFPFWLPFALLGAWFVAMFVVGWAAIAQQADRAAGAVPPAG